MSLRISKCHVEKNEHVLCEYYGKETLKNLKNNLIWEFTKWLEMPFSNNKLSTIFISS